MDFTLDKYQRLLAAFQQNGYSFYTYEEYCEKKTNEKFVILRHDVDLKAENSLQTAKIEYQLGIKASYYFRIQPQSNKPAIIKQIAELGHEIGYHYEDLAIFNGDAKKAIEHFQLKLAYFRQFYPVKTISMHGNPTRKIDNKEIWKSYNYRNFGIIGEVYVDTDFNQVFYLTDTGRCWDGEKYSIRDKVSSPFTQKFHTTDQIIRAIETKTLAHRLMLNTHPQRWTNNKLGWELELVFQRMKNIIKRILLHNTKVFAEK